MRKLLMACLVLTLPFLAGAGEASPVCSVMRYCPNGVVISCQGSGPYSICTSGNFYVRCDQQTTYCGCTASIQCTSGTVLSCTIPPGPSPGICEAGDPGSDWVKCGTKRHYCPPAENDPFDPE